MVRYLAPDEAAVSAMTSFKSKSVDWVGAFLTGPHKRCMNWLARFPSLRARKPSRAGLYVGDDASKRQIRLMGDRGGQLSKDSDARSGRKYDQTSSLQASVGYPLVVGRGKSFRVGSCCWKRSALRLTQPRAYARSRTSVAWL